MSVWSNLARSARKATGLTQKEFAEKIGASRATVGSWEAGLREPSRLSISLLCLMKSYGKSALAKLWRCHRQIEVATERPRPR